MNPLLAPIFAIIGSFVDDWKASRQNKRDVDKAVADNKIRLAQSAETHNENWEMAALQGKDDALRRTSFVIWSTPFIWAIFDPQGVKTYFTTILTVLPDWYVMGYLGITGAIWGIVTLKNAGIIMRR